MPVAPVWLNRTQAAEYLGVEPLGVTLLIHHKVAPPDCYKCGRIRWRLLDLQARREELRAWVGEHHPQYLLPEPKEQLALF